VSDRPAGLVISSSPYVKDATTTPTIMRDVTLAACVVLAAATWHFGVGSLLVAGACVLGAVVTEWAFTRDKAPSPIRDWSAALTGLLLGLTLPPAMPLWMAFLGGVAGIGLGKLIWGGLGQNLFNPALVGRAFLQAAFPTSITTWSVTAAEAGSHTQIPNTVFAAPLMHVELDAMSGATPLGLAKFQDQSTEVMDLLTGVSAGSLGETNAIVLILCGVFLWWRRAFDWRLPVSTLATVAVLAAALHAFRPDDCPGAAFYLLSGGLMLGAIFMVTDPVTTPTTKKGAWLFGIGVGFLVVLIRAYGGLPEGVMYAILLMNAVTPHIEKYTQPRPFGGSRGG